MKNCIFCQSLTLQLSVSGYCCTNCWGTPLFLSYKNILENIKFEHYVNNDYYVMQYTNEQKISIYYKDNNLDQLIPEILIYKFPLPNLCLNSIKELFYFVLNNKAFL